MTENLAYTKNEEDDMCRRDQNTDEEHVRANDLTDGEPRDQVLTIQEPSEETLNDIGLLYTISDNPPWYLCILLGLQHYLTAFGGILSLPLIIAPAFCLEPNSVGTAEILSTLIFVSGIITLLQTTFGTRLPIIQGGTFSLLVPTFAIMNLDKWKCPELPDYTNTTLYNDTLREELDRFKEEVWHSHIREIQGAIIVSSLVEVLVGAIGVFGFMLQFIGPLATAPTITLVGVALFKTAAQACEGQWWISIATIVCIITFSHLLYKCDVPLCRVSRKPEGQRECVKRGKLPFFKMFPMLLSICLMWLICYILTQANVLPSDPNEWGYSTRTDTRIEVLKKAPWFRVPYPFQWGLPTLSAAGVIGMLAGVIAGMVESLGDYYACARLCGAPPPPIHAINRGIMIEGIGSTLSGIWGSGTGTTSFSENIGAIGITKVGSRVVIQTAGLLMVFLGMFGKFGALFVTIPSPIIGGVFMVTFGMITSVGISNLQHVDMNSSRNLFIVGFSLFFGLAMPQWLDANRSAINTGVPQLDQVFTVLLSTSMFVGGSVGFILDNIIPGTENERGIKTWRSMLVDGKDKGSEGRMHCYDLPWCMGCLRRVALFKYLPFCPMFSCCDARLSKDESPAEDNGNVITTL